MMNIKELSKAHNWNLPTVCPRCGSVFIVNPSGIPECPNEECIAKAEHRIARFLEVLNVKAGGPAFVEKAAAVCNNLAKPLLMFVKFCSIEDKVAFNKWAGGINGEKILKQIREYMWYDFNSGKTNTPPKSITAAQFCAMFDYPRLSVKQFEKIPDFNMTKVLTNIPYNELKNVNGIGDELADQITTFLTYYHDELEEMSHYFNIESNKKEEITDMPTICFTGACPGHTRKELAEMCKNKYTVVDSVTKDTQFLVCADPNSGSSKLQKAAKNGTKIISYDDLLKSL